MSIYGTVRASTHTATDEENLIFTFRIEFHSVEAANWAVASLARDPIWGLSDDETWHWTMLIDDLGRLMTHRHLQQVDFRGLTRHPADAHNRVRREKIMDGTDVRTTIMLRNIPNKLDWMTLKGPAAAGTTAHHHAYSSHRSSYEGDSSGRESAALKPARPGRVIRRPSDPGIFAVRDP
ncbi:hypothetical protein BU26DRAFT_609975 [Trematosphaeria pertusa]|uniref:Uncharacterized protein n=1 Tax=Trematosphaeria pertusa TaxID=390896 RepID=A0A6A6HXR3_9PLEO|nr:uncharacterized protein BU26DRAFT_609975 [Trematosphaeria pertusa]KAF2242679.1 hypothetical protein BU26DRAFT_609975 [Trematosphaeria pertusa]